MGPELETAFAELHKARLNHIIQKLQACTSSAEGYKTIDPLPVRELKEIADKLKVKPFSRRKDDYRHVIVYTTVTSRIEHALIRGHGKETAE